jgi:pheromone shutdown protein TraB
VAASIVAKSNFKDSMVVIVLAAMHRNGINVRSTPQEQFAGMRKLKHYCKNPKLSSLCIFLSFFFYFYFYFFFLFYFYFFIIFLSFINEIKLPQKNSKLSPHIFIHELIAN